MHPIKQLPHRDQPHTLTSTLTSPRTIIVCCYVTGLQGPLPDSLGGLARLWRLNILGTNMRCDNTTQQPAPCPLPSWLVQQRHRYYYELTGLECPVLQFVQERDDAEKLALIYRGAAQPEVGCASVWLLRWWWHCVKS
jgi:hypothetical protein